MILPPPNPSLNDTIALLAQLPTPEYDRVRKAEAQRLKIQLKTLDDEVKAARLQAAPTNQPRSRLSKPG